MWLSKEALQRAEERRKVKSKGERERYTLLNAEFQRIVCRDKKAFLMNNAKKQKTTEWERSLQENWRYQENISCKDRHDKRTKMVRT